MSHQKLTGDFPTAALGADPPSNKLPPNWDTMDFGVLCCALNNPAHLYREGRAANSTADAVLYALRKGSRAAVSEQVERLQQFSDQQIEELIRRLKKSGVDGQLLHILVELLP